MNKFSSSNEAMRVNKVGIWVWSIFCILKNASNADNLLMVLFDNLFTNVPLDETRNIILDQFFILHNSTVIWLT